jgi:hypothetical protein
MAGFLMREIERKTQTQHQGSAPMKRSIFFALLLSTLPLAAQQLAPTPTPTPTPNSASAVGTTGSSVVQSIRLLRAQIAAGRRDLKASIKFEKQALKLGEAQIRLQIVRRQEAVSLAAARAAK